ncbi:MAG: FIST C-terminal domain-containing protein [Candidatus Thiodiazotropha sp. (ex Notomyrtea botanica)]|nr:FIST C-terminal domain-containing protein [Candidatus Thiodiazotropha sp. (ex Notomyrtea botanica)]
MNSVILSPLSDVAAISDHIRQWQQAFPASGVLALVAEGSNTEVPALQTCFNELGVPLVGAVFPEIHHAGEFHRQGVLLIRLNPMCDFHSVVSLDGTQTETDQAIEKLAGKLRDRLVDDEPATLFMLFDALVPKIGSILEALYLQLAASVHYAGANAGSETFQPMPCLFDNDRFVQNGLLAMLLKSHDGAVLEHSYQVPDQMVAATSTEGNCIVNIDWKPAFEIYREKIQQLYGVEVNRENFYDYAVHFPFGILRADDEVLVRIPVALEENGSLFCIGEVPEHAVLTLLEAPQQEALKSAQILAERLVNKSKPMLTFYCAGRRLHLGEVAATRELCELQQAISNDPIFGALSLGEIGSSQRGGYPLFHNATLVCMSI